VTRSSTKPDGIIARYFNAGAIPFWGAHVGAVAGVIALGFSWSGVAIALGFYVVRMFFVTAGYHRYFSHRAFKTSRGFQLALAIGAQTAVQRGVLWWAATHRHHHKHADQPDDIHSARRDGFWWAHVGWSTSPTSDVVDYDQIKDLTKFPELVWLDRWKHLPAIAIFALMFVVGGAHLAVWGGLVSTVLLWHGTFTINSLSHLIGTRRYDTGDNSRNNWVLALITLGEGWHNNHHHYMTSANQGFRWWQIDPTFYGLRLLGWLGVVWDVRRPPADVIANVATIQPATTSMK
jgi:stearoyl-CoA desaturase (delta-9 desaturase)